MKRRKLAIIALSAACVFAPAAAFADGQMTDHVNKTPEEVAVDGYDVVAYFTESKPVKGSPQYERKWRGATWRFATAASRDAFARNPEKYTPQYGGFCAYGVSKGHESRIDPNAWAIVGGKLYLNSSKAACNRFKADKDSVRMGDENWSRMRK